MIDFISENDKQSLVTPEDHQNFVKALKLEKAEVAVKERANALRLELEEWPTKY